MNTQTTPLLLSADQLLTLDDARPSLTDAALLIENDRIKDHADNFQEET